MLRRERLLRTSDRFSRRHVSRRDEGMAEGHSRKSASDGGFPVSAGILFGLGLGGLFDGIVLHQILQWHHMLTNVGYPADSVDNLKVNTFWDGIFHASTYLFTAL